MQIKHLLDLGAHLPLLRLWNGHDSASLILYMIHRWFMLGRGDGRGACLCGALQKQKPNQASISKLIVVIGG